MGGRAVPLNMEGTDFFAQNLKNSEKVQSRFVRTEKVDKYGQLQANTINLPQIKVSFLTYLVAN